MVDLIPREVLFGNPERVSPHISPDGSQLAWIAPHDGVLNVWVAPVGADGVDWDGAKVVTEDTDRGIRFFAWARDGRHLLYIQDTGGDENWRLYDVDMETMARRDLTPFDGIQARIIATRKSHRDEVLVGINRDNPQLHDVYRLSLTSGELDKLIENPGYAGWIADEDMVVRGAISPLPDGGFDVLVRDGEQDEWRTLLTIPADDVAASDVLAFTGDGRSLLAISSIDTDTGRLVRIDLGTGDAQVLVEDPEADVAGAMLHPDTREPQIVEVLKDRTEYHVLDPSVEPDSRRSARCTPATRSRSAATRPTTPGWSRSPTTPGRSSTTPTTGPAGPAASCSPAVPNSPGSTWPGWSRSRSRRGTG